MKLEAGKTYVTRGGAKAKVEVRMPPDPFTGTPRAVQCRTWTAALPAERHAFENAAQSSRFNSGPNHFCRSVAMTGNKKRFSLGAILSLTTRRLLCDFSDLYELAEWVGGYPIFTHEFADNATFAMLRDRVLSEHPQLAAVSGDDVTRENWQAKLAEWVAEFGETLEITAGTGERKESPLETLNRVAPGKPAIVVGLGRAEGSRKDTPA